MGKRLILLMALSLTLASGYPCAPVMRAGSNATLNNENALIVWNKTTSTEHFIREAHFDTDTPDFGFLVPTPTQPTLNMLTEQPQWCLFMSWAELTFEQNSPQQILDIYQSPRVITRERLPQFTRIK
jgi:hypothetical protein